MSSPSTVLLLDRCPPSELLVRNAHNTLRFVDDSSIFLLHLMLAFATRPSCVRCRETRETTRRRPGSSGHSRRGSATPATSA